MTMIETARNISDLRKRVETRRALRRDGIDFAVRHLPACVENGDFAVSVRIGPERWIIAIGDVMGRGSVAAALAERVVDHVTDRAGEALSLGDLMSTTNEMVHTVTDGERFVSMLLLDVDARRGTVRMANAGHEAPMAVGRSGGVVALEGHGPALGLLADFHFKGSGPLRLAKGMVLLAMTDGVVEAVDDCGHTYGRARASKALAEGRERGPKSVVRRIIREVEDFATYEDDRSALALRFV